jgi:hypothetical protein
LTLDNVLPVLALQITDSQHPDNGIVNPEWGLAAVGNTISFIGGGRFLYLAHMGHQHRALDLNLAELLAKASLAAECLLRLQRASGLIDLHDCRH